MIDPRAESIIYQAQGYLVDLINELITDKRLGKALNKEWDKADLILSYLEAWEERLKLDDINDINYVLECLISLCELNQYPSAPVITGLTPPAILTGIPGPPGTSVTGPKGDTGLATDFQTILSASGPVDSFDITDARSARWDYTVIQNTGEQRSGTIIGTWNADGSLIELSDNSTNDIVGPTTPIEFDIQYSGGDIQLVVIITSGTWSVIGVRYFIPNNGNGAGPISDVLADGSVYIGNTSNLAQARVVSGVINITNTGVTSFTVAGADAIVSVLNISSTTTINLTNLTPVTANRVLISNGAGQIIASGTTSTTLGFLDIGSSLTTLLAAKLTDPTTTIGDLIYRDGTNVINRLGIGSSNQVLTVVGGVPTWQPAPGGISGLTTGYIPKASSATTINDSVISQSGSAINIAGTLEIFSGFRTQTTGSYYKLIEIQDTWDMDASPIKGITHGLPDSTKFSIVAVTILVGSLSYPLSKVDSSMILQGNIQAWDNTTVLLRRLPGGEFDSPIFNAATVVLTLLYKT